MRQSRLSGSVEGVMGNHDSYSDLGGTLGCNNSEGKESGEALYARTGLLCALQAKCQRCRIGVHFTLLAQIS